jgi:hypothetical protein
VSRLWPQQDHRFPVLHLNNETQGQRCSPPAGLVRVADLPGAITLLRARHRQWHIHRRRPHALTTANARLAATDADSNTRGLRHRR